MFGYPDTLVSDNGQQFTSNDFEFYLQTHNIKHQLTSLYWPQANGEVEKFNRTITKTIKCALTEGKDWKKVLQQFLLMYCTTLHTTTGTSPAQMLFHHLPNNGLPTIQLSKSTVSNAEKLIAENKTKSIYRQKTVHQTLGFSNRGERIIKTTKNKI